MKQNFTPEHLLLYIYKEVTPFEELTIEQALDADDALYEQYLELYEAYQQLPKVQFSPPTQAVNNVLAFSRQYSMAV